MRTGSTVILGQNVAARRIHPAAVGKGANPPVEPGTRLDRYLVVERLGGGGMGQVYRARDSELDRDVALKILAPPYCYQADALNRFRAEAQAQARLRSPHVVTLYSMLELPFAAMLVLEYLEGETLESRLRKGGPLALEDAVAVFDQALLGLAHVHDMGVIHRDLKPSNLFLTSGGQVKIMDFSVAKLAVRDAYPPRTMVGTLLYISPEQISGREIDLRSDIYALGVSLYEAVTGRLPFERGTDYALMHAHVQEQPKSPRDIVPSLPNGFERAILKAIEKEPGRRYRSALEFREALLKLGTRSQSRSALLPANAFGPVPRGGQYRRSGRRVFASLGLDLLLVAAIGAMLYALGLYPAPGASVDATTTVSAPPAPLKAAAERPAPARKPPAVRTGPGDPYGKLRQAWGE